MQTFRDIIDLWPTPDVLATEIGENVWTVRKWKQRGRIPASRWIAVANAARAKGNLITAEQMAKMVAREAV